MARARKRSLRPQPPRNLPSAPGLRGTGSSGLFSISWVVSAAVVVASGFLPRAVPPVEAQGGVIPPEIIRVRLSVPGDSLRAVLPDGAELVVRGTKVPLPAGETTVSVASAGWRLLVPANASPALLAIAGGDSGGGSQPTGHFDSRRSVERVRRILRAEFGALPETSRTGWHISLNATLLETEPVPLELVAPAGGNVPISLNGRHYRGDLRLEPAGAAYVVTNLLPLEEYLYSVVGSEMPSNWEPEALKAQAVAARTYALRQIDLEAEFDICDSTACQAYRGIEAESASAREAVEATRGIVATYDGEPIDAVYSANMGGQTAASEDVWSTYSPYLRPVASPYDDLALDSGWAADDFEWKLTLTPPQLLAGLRGRGYDLSSLEGVSVIADDGRGRATAVEIRGRPRDLMVYRDEIRYALGIKSNVFNVSAVGESAERVIFRAPGVSDGQPPAGTPAGGYRRSVSFDEIPAPYRLNNGSIFTREIVVPEQIVISGRGVGHGVGMSQWGAQGMALAGQSYEDILKHYFTGIALTQAR